MTRPVRPLADFDDDLDPAPRPAGRRRHSGARSASRKGPRAGLKRSVLRTIRQLPSYLRLLIGLVGDSRVSRVDRFMVVAAIAYIVSPIDLLPDLIPFLGEVDDIFLLMMALQRLVEHAGRRVLLDHWRGDPDELEDLNIGGIVSAAGFFLPSRMRRRLQRMVTPRRRSRRHEYDEE